MRKKEALSGAPMFRGRYAALIWLWISGFLAGDMDLGLVWVFVSDPPITRTHWSIDIVMASLSVFSLIMGLISLDQYGRNAWFAWAPDDTQWGGFTRSDVNRKPVFDIAAWAYDWNRHVWFKNDK